METGDPTFAYELEQAISDEFLVGFKAMSVPLRFRRESIKYEELSEEEREEYETKFRDEETRVEPRCSRGRVCQTTRRTIAPRVRSYPVPVRCRPRWLEPLFDWARAFRKYSYSRPW